MKLSFVQENFGTLLVAFLFLRNGLLEISVELVSCRKSRRPSSIHFLPTSQAVAEEVEIPLSSQGSRIVNVEKSSFVYSFLVRAHNCQILRIEQESTPRIDQSFLATLLFVAIANIECCTLSFSCSSPHHGQFRRPLDLICISVMTVRRRDVTPPSFSTTVLTTSKSHELTLSSFGLSTLDTRMVK
jgi:hypothetical protein